MKFIMEKDADARTLTFRGELTESDLASLRLDHLDRMVIAEEPQNAADCLLALEIIFRNLLSQREQAA